MADTNAAFPRDGEPLPIRSRGLTVELLGVG
jgi:hypothetical protein